MASMGHLKRICNDAFSVTGPVQDTSSPALLGGPGADFLRGVPFWQYFRQVGGLEKSQNALVPGRQLCTQLSIFEGSLAELFRF